MKNQALFSSKDKSKKLTCRLLQFLFGPLRVKIYHLFIASFFLQSIKYVLTSFVSSSLIGGNVKCL